MLDVLLSACDAFCCGILLACITQPLSATTLPSGSNANGYLRLPGAVLPLQTPTSISSRLYVVIIPVEDALIRVFPMQSLK
jgi:hypothetical protein